MPTEQSWTDLVSETLSAIESQMSDLEIPVVRGSLVVNGATLIRIEEYDFKAHATVIGAGSICVINLRASEIAIADGPDREDLLVYVRLGSSSTWLLFCLIAPDPDGPEDATHLLSEDDEWPFETGQRIASEVINKKALLVARAPGFAALRSRSDRRDFAAAILGVEPSTQGEYLELWEIAGVADSIFSLGILPSLARSLNSQGKKISEIVRALGVSRVKAERAVATVVPAHIAKIMADEPESDLSLRSS